MLLRDPAAYNKKVEEYVSRFASSSVRTPAPVVPAYRTSLEDMKESSSAIRNDSVATATTIESAASAPADGGEDDYMSDASELSDL